MTGPAQAINTAKTGPADATLGGFPAYYTDDAGVSLQPCIDGTANCAGATAIDDGAGGPGISVAGDGEGFYWSTDSTLNSRAGSINIIMAHEGAWASATQPIVFDRLRIRGDLRAGNYTLQTPYGSQKFATDGAGARNVNFTADPGCALVAGGACTGPVTNFLRSTSAPAGYLGNGTSATTVTGGTVRNEFVLRGANGAVLGRTNRFIVLGKLAPGPQAALSTEAVNFGNTKAVRKRPVRIRNIGDAALNLNAVRMVGANRVKLAPGGCGATLAARSVCTETLVYRPGAQKALSGRLVINDNSIARTHSVPVKASTTSVASSQRRLRFRATNVGSRSAVRRVVVTNTGVVPLRVKGVSVKGANARSFQRRSGRGPLCAKGARVRVGKACALYVRFAPQNFGAKTADLVVRTNAAAGAHRIVLAGRGR